MLIIEPGYPLDPGPKALLEQSHTLMTTLFEPEENYFLGFEALCAPNVHFFIAREGDAVLGTGAVVDRETYGEVKSMFTSTGARGKGVAGAILRALEDHARGLNLPVLRLETALRLEEAVRLYASHGYTPCGRFGDYRPNDTSYFMEKRLA